MVKRLAKTSRFLKLLFLILKKSFPYLLVIALLLYLLSYQKEIYESNKVLNDFLASRNKIVDQINQTQDLAEKESLLEEIILIDSDIKNYCNIKQCSHDYFEIDFTYSLLIHEQIKLEQINTIFEYLVKNDQSINICLNDISEKSEAATKANIIEKCNKQIDDQLEYIQSRDLDYDLPKTYKYYSNLLIYWKEVISIYKNEASNNSLEGNTIEEFAQIVRENKIEAQKELNQSLLIEQIQANIIELNERLNGSIWGN